METNSGESGESGARNLEAESIRSGAESTGGRVKWKTVTEIRQSSARNTFIAESVYLVLKKKNHTTLPKQRRQCLFAFQVFES